MMKERIEQSLGFAIEPPRFIGGNPQSACYLVTRSEDGFRFVLKTVPTEAEYRSLCANLEALKGTVVAGRLFADRELEVDGVRFLALEYRDGEHLGALDLDDGRFAGFLDDYAALSRALAKCREVLPARETLEYAGAKSVVHGDFHPGNLAFSNGRLSGVFDIGDIRRGLPAEDLVRYFAHAAERLPVFAFGLRRKILRRLVEAVKRLYYPVDEWLAAIDSHAAYRMKTRCAASAHPGLERIRQWPKLRLYGKMAEAVRGCRRHGGRVLVIRHGALGDFTMATGAMKEIRRRHPDAEITLMTQRFLSGLGKNLGFFDRVEVDDRSRSPLSVLATLLKIACGRYDLVYDLQGTHRTRRTYRFGARLLGYRGGWTAVGDRTFDLGFPLPDLSMLHGDNEHFDLLPARYALLIPGCGPKNPEKRWPAENYRELTKSLGGLGLGSVVLGTKAEAAEIDAICRDNPNAVSFMGLSKLADIPDLARRASVVIGNDTGPTHMARLTGAKTVLLLPPYSAHLAVETESVKPFLSKSCVSEIPVSAVTHAVSSFIPRPSSHP